MMKLRLRKNQRLAHDHPSDHLQSRSLGFWAPDSLSLNHREKEGAVQEINQGSVCGLLTLDENFQEISSR